MISDAVAVSRDDLTEFQTAFDRIAERVNAVVRGKRDVVRIALVCLFARGHLLIEDVPGVAKTSMAKAVARAVGGSVKRIQFTPDLLPSDLIGVDVFDQRDLEFRFRPGPIFANVVLGDEINRASPKTQSALLEVMAERQVTVGDRTYPVPDPFLCIATQNPVEHQGTFPLPEAQLDRFMMRIKVGYPAAAEESKIIRDPGLRNGRAGRDTAGEAPVHKEDLVRLMSMVDRIQITEELAGYIVRLAEATRGDAGERRGISLGVSPRGTVALATAAQALAASQVRSYVTADDVKRLAGSVFSHRLILQPGSAGRRRKQDDVIAEILDHVHVPGV